MLWTAVIIEFDLTSMKEQISMAAYSFMFLNCRFGLFNKN